jgi:hypothetical protein
LGVQHIVDYAATTKIEGFPARHLDITHVRPTHR